MTWKRFIGEPQCIDCLDLLARLPDNCVNLIFTDPPYNIGVFKKMPAGEYLEWCEKWIVECSRVLVANGAFWISHSKPDVLVDISRTIERYGRRRRNWVTWDKYNAAGKLQGFMDGFTVTGTVRSFQPMVEYLVWHADEGNWTRKCDKERGFIFEPLRAYFEREMLQAGWTKAKLKRQWMDERNNKSEMPRHWFEKNQYGMPTEKNYQWLRQLFNCNNGDKYLCQEYEYLCREYKYLRREYEDLRREYEYLRYTFNNPGKVSSVWQIPPAPRQKPMSMYVCRKENRKWRAVGKDAVSLLKRVISEFMLEMDRKKWSIGWCGSSIMAACQMDSLSTMLTVTNRITESGIWNSSVRLPTSDCIVDVFSLTENGGSHVLSVENSSECQPASTSEKTEDASPLAVKCAASEMLSEISKEDVWELRQVAHPTPKPEQLLERIILATSNEDDIILDCFAGSFTTARVAQRLGRRWICSDVNPEYVEKAKTELERLGCKTLSLW